MNTQFKIFIIALFTLVLTACSGGGGTNTSVTSFELLDPTPTANNRFGEKVVILPNGNIVVSAPNDSSVASSSGAVHLYNPYTQKLIASLYGDTAGDRLGSDGITALANNNFVVASQYDDEGGIANAGTVRLVSGTTGAQIGSTLAGDVANDQLGMTSITALANNNFVVVSRRDDEGGIVDAGSVRLVSGTTGAQLGILAGDAAGDQLGYTSITALANNNFVVASAYDDAGIIVDAGSVRLVNGTTGVQIGSTLTGNTSYDKLGASSITALANNNFVIASQLDDAGMIVDAGSVWLVNGTTGAQIGSTLVGDVADDFLGSDGITALANNNFVITSVSDDEGGIVNAGSVRLVDGSTGAQIGSTLAGDVTNDKLGVSGITVLANNNFVVASIFDDENSIVDAGSVRLVDGTTGAQIGSTLAGDVANDQLGRTSITALANNNFVIASSLDDENSVVDAGTVRLVNGTTGAQIGSTFVGDVANDQLGFSSITALANNNFVVASAYDDEGGIINVGSVRLVNGTTGVQIGSTLAGDVASDRLGSGITALANNNFVVASSLDDEGGIVNVGSVRLMNGTTGMQIGSTLAGDVANDQLGSSGITTLANNNFVIASRFDDENSIVDAGSIRQMDGDTGNQIRTIVGSVADDTGVSQIIESSSGDFYILSLPYQDNNAMVDSGFVTLITVN